LQAEIVHLAHTIARFCKSKAQYICALVSIAYLAHSVTYLLGTKNDN